MTHCLHSVEVLSCPSKDSQVFLQGQRKGLWLLQKGSTPVPNPDPLLWHDAREVQRTPSILEEEAPQTVNPSH